MAKGLPTIGRLLENGSVTRNRRDITFSLPGARVVVVEVRFARDPTNFREALTEAGLTGDEALALVPVGMERDQLRRVVRFGIPRARSGGIGHSAASSPPMPVMRPPAGFRPSVDRTRHHRRTPQYTNNY